MLAAIRKKPRPLDPDVASNLAVGGEGGKGGAQRRGPGGPSQGIIGDGRGTRHAGRTPGKTGGAPLAMVPGRAAAAK